MGSRRLGLTPNIHAACRRGPIGKRYCRRGQSSHPLGVVAVADSSEDAVTTGVTIDFDLTREETVPILRWVVRQGKVMRRIFASNVLMVLGGVLIIAGAAVGGSAPALAGGIGVAAYGLLMMGFLRWRFARGSDRSWDKTLGTVGPRTMTFTADGVRTVTRMSDTTNKWPLYSETIEREGMYLLKLARSTLFAAYVLVPRRAFGSTADEDQFRRLATAHTKAEFEVQTD